MEGRIWQRGASKGRKGSTNKRMMAQTAEDQMMQQRNKYSDQVGNDFGEEDPDAMAAAL